MGTLVSTLVLQALKGVALMLSVILRVIDLLRVIGRLAVDLGFHKRLVFASRVGFFVEILQGLVDVDARCRSARCTLHVADARRRSALFAAQNDDRLPRQRGRVQRVFVRRNGIVHCQKYGNIESSTAFFVADRVYDAIRKKTLSGF